MNRKTFIIALLCILSVNATPCLAARFVSSSQYVNTVISFISGTKAQSGSTIFMALNAREQNRRGGILLFKGTEVTKDDMLHACYDPAKLPFVAQAVMKNISEIDKGNYGYYQRRLAEFQAALDSAVNIGRFYMPKKCFVLDLTGVEGTLVAAAHENTICPDRKEKKRWANGDTASLVKLVANADKNRYVILVDGWTPPPVSECLRGYERKIYMPTAELGANYFISLNSIYKYVAKRIKQFEAAENKTGDKKPAAGHKE